jgi:uncharacterized protein (DUF1778 family)
VTLSGIDDTMLDTEERRKIIMSDNTKRTEKLDLRLTGKAKQVLRDAATASRRSVSEFVLESAMSRAEETLADRRYFGLGVNQWTAFMAALDAPPRELPRLKKLFEEPSIFERT